MNFIELFFKKKKKTLITKLKRIKPLYSLPLCFVHFIDAMLYKSRRDTISVDDVKDDLNSKKLKKISENCDENYIEGLVVRDKPNVEGNRK